MARAECNDLCWCVNFSSACIHWVNTGLFLKPLPAGGLAGQATGKTSSAADGQSGLADTLPAHLQLGQIFGMLDILRQSSMLSASL